jgi:preprotein translocase subunit SecY
MDLRKIFDFIPEVTKPEEKKLDFNTKLKWTLVILVSFFVLANVTLFGLSVNALERFEFLAIILAADFGSIITLGIGPIVMASIILQLLSGSGIINIDQTTTEGKRFFMGIQKLLVLFFIIFEATVYVLMKGLQADPNLAGFGPLILIVQLILGGIAIFYMDEVSNKWGFGSGVSLFIGAGVSRSLFTAAFQFINQQGRNCLLDFNNTACSGKVFVLVQSIINRYPLEFISAFGAILATVVIFLIVVWAQSLKVEIPLSFGRIRGYGVKWPLSFFYASVIPVILTAALIANVQLFGGIIENAAAPCLIDGGECFGMAKFASYFDFLGHFIDGQPVSGLAFWMGSTNLLELFIRGGFLWTYFLQGITHILFFVIFCSIFSIFWVKTSGMDSQAQAKNIASSGLQVAGFRQDQRILESILDRYIMPLTIMGGIAIGLLASVTDLLGAMVGGTSILLVIMIMFQFYQNIAQQHSVDMNPVMRKFMGGN